jgi:hypothetical protein
MERVHFSFRAAIISDFFHLAYGEPSSQTLGKAIKLIVFAVF